MTREEHLGEARDLVRAARLLCLGQAECDADDITATSVAAILSPAMARLEAALGRDDPLGRYDGGHHDQS